MARFRPRRPLLMETLESRQLLSVGTSPLEQYALEQLNRARTNPSEVAVDVTSNLDRAARDTFQFYNVDIHQTRNEIASTPSAQPLAWDPRLADAAERLGKDMAENGFQSHVGSDGSSIEQRLDDAGYRDRGAYAENAFAYAESVDQAMQAFLVDYGVDSKGHRNNIYNDSFREVGLSVNATSRRGVGPKVIVQNFGTEKSDKPYLLGVAYDDKNGDERYDVGEGTDQLAISVTPIDGGSRQATGGTKELRPWASGGYQTQLDPGLYRVVAKKDGRVLQGRDVAIHEDNVKVDFDLSGPWQDYEPEMTAPATTPTPTPTPTPAPKPTANQASWTGVTQQPASTPAPRVAPKTLSFSWGNLNWKGWNAKS